MKLNTVLVNGTDDLGDDAATFQGVLFSPSCGFQIAVNATQARRRQQTLSIMPLRAANRQVQTAEKIKKYGMT